MSFKLANPRKLALINSGLLIGLFMLFSLLIHHRAVKDTTWLDTIAIPLALAVGIVVTLNVVILAATRRGK